MTKKILLLHETGEAPDGLAELAGEMRALGADVVTLACAEPYGAVLDAVEAADSVVFWR
jgi:hypothetical protein